MADAAGLPGPHGLARAAAAAFLGSVPELTSLGHGESAAFRVGTEYLLRVHLPSRSGADPAYWTRTALEAELDWLEALGRDTDIAVQRPARAPGGERVLLVPGPDGESVPCTLLSWVRGEVLDEQPSAEQSRRCGRLVAALHEHAHAWRRPARFERPVHEPSIVHDALQRFAAAGIAEPEPLRVLERAAVAAVELAQATPRTPDHWGLIHADLHEGNTLFVGDEPSPIDFGCCGFGYWLYDIAESLLHRLPDGWTAFLAGYGERRPLPEGHLRLIEAFFLVASLTGFAHQTERGDDKERLARVARMVSERYARPFLAGQSFLV